MNSYAWLKEAAECMWPILDRKHSRCIFCVMPYIHCRCKSSHAESSSHRIHGSVGQ